MPKTPGTHLVDLHVGQRVRLARREQHMSQEALAKACGVTFQQIQKYERGANRVSASMLWTAARALRQNLGYFYEGLPDAPEGEGSADRVRRQFGQTPRGAALLEVAAQLPPGVLGGFMEAMLSVLAMQDERAPKKVCV